MTNSHELDVALQPAPEECGVNIELPNGFILDGRGVWHCPVGKPPMLLTGPLAVLGQARDPNGHGWGLLLRWSDPDGRPHQGPVRFADLAGEGVEVFRPLISAGLQVASDARHLKLLKGALLGLKCAARVRVVKQAGWYGRAFVLPTGTIGDTADERVMFDGNAEAARYSTEGTLDDWINSVAHLCAGNTRLIFAASVAFAGPLNDLLRGDGGGFNLVGPSSLGKTTLLQVAGSVYGGGGNAGFAHTWRGTENGLEGIARAHSGTLLVLDEMGEADSRTIGHSAYTLVNGRSKARANRAAEARAQEDWRTMLLSSGELDLADKIAEGGQQARAGQLVRLVDVPADAGRGLGAFEDTKGLGAAAFSETLKSAARLNYGFAGPAFIEGLAADKAGVEREVRTRIGGITAKLLDGITPSDGQTHRVAARFALVATAGELARELLHLPWADGEAERAVAECFDAWRAGRGGDGSGELVAALNALCAATECHGESRFRNLDRFDAVDPGSATVIQNSAIRDLLGYRFTHGGEMVWGFTASGLKEVVGGICKPTTVVKMLAERGMLVSGADRAHRLAKRIGGRTHNLIAVKARGLETWGMK